MFQPREVLNVRILPELNSTKVGSLMYKQIVTIKSNTGKKLTIKDTDKQTGITKEINGEWVEIAGYGIKGFVFNGFLKKYEENLNDKVSEFEIIGLPGLYCLDAIKEKWEADCLSIRFDWQRANGDIYVVDKKYGAADPDYFVYFLKRDGNKIYFKKGHNGYDLGWF